MSSTTSTCDTFTATAMQPYSHTALQPYSHTALQPCSHAAMQPYSLAAIQPCSHTTSVAQHGVKHHLSSSIIIPHRNTLHNASRDITPHHSVSCCITSHLISYHIISSHHISSHVISFHVISCHLISCHLKSSLLISSLLISPHLITPRGQQDLYCIGVEPAASHSDLLQPQQCAALVYRQQRLSYSAPPHMLSLFITSHVNSNRRQYRQHSLTHTHTHSLSLSHTHTHTHTLTHRF
jgi:hypothetical protein